MPSEMQMPQLTQSALIAVFGALVLACVAHALLLLQRKRDDRLLIMLGGGAAAALLEGFACHLIHCAHAVVGNIEVYESFGIHVPLWLALLYVLFFGALPYYFLRGFAARPSSTFFWRVFAITGVCEATGEMVTSFLGTHVYWGMQPLMIFGFPLYLGFLNPACAMATALVAALWFDSVRGVARWALIALTPMILAAVYSGLTFPTIAFIHAAAPLAAVMGSIATMLLCLGLSAFVRHSLPRFASQYRVH